MSNAEQDAAEKNLIDRMRVQGQKSIDESQVNGFGGGNSVVPAEVKAVDKEQIEARNRLQEIVSTGVGSAGKASGPVDLDSMEGGELKGGFFPLLGTLLSTVLPIGKFIVDKLSGRGLLDGMNQKQRIALASDLERDLNSAEFNKRLQGNGLVGGRTRYGKRPSGSYGYYDEDSHGRQSEAKDPEKRGQRREDKEFLETLKVLAEKVPEVAKLVAGSVGGSGGSKKPRKPRASKKQKALESTRQLLDAAAKNNATSAPPPTQESRPSADLVRAIQGGALQDLDSDSLHYLSAALEKSVLGKAKPSYRSAQQKALDKAAQKAVKVLNKPKRQPSEFNIMVRNYMKENPGVKLGAAAKAVKALMAEQDDEEDEDENAE